MPCRQENQGARVVPSRRDYERLRFLNLGVPERRFLSAVSLKRGDAAPDGRAGPTVLEVNYDDLLRVRSLRQQFLYRRRSCIAEAADDDVSIQGGFQRRHTVALHVLSDDELIRRAEEQEPDGDPYGRHDQRIDEAGPRRDRYDIAVPHRGHRNHAEINDIAERDLSVDLVAQAVAIQPEDGGDGTQQRKRDDEPREKFAARQEVGRGVEDARRGVTGKRLPHGGGTVAGRKSQVKAAIPTGHDRVPAGSIIADLIVQWRVDRRIYDAVK